MNSSVAKLISHLSVGETIKLSKTGLMVDITLISDNGKEFTSSLPNDHHLDEENVSDCIEFMRKKIE